jgi:3-hydroxy acid dehydrogenase / malonic semialdehyde reductase
MCATAAPCSDAIDELPPEWAEIDILVNNAGLSRGMDKLYTGKIEDWEEMIDTNVKGLLYVARAVVPGMVVRGRGHVVNLGSTAGEITYPNGAVYCGSKAAERHQRRAARGSAGNAGARDQRRSRDGGDRFQPGALPRRRGTRGQGLQGHYAADPEDVADVIVWAVTRPAHVNIAACR